ncbi:MAG TPA: cell division protein FtsL [Clostridiaceae bacterium]|nr:cell division protein FtsL [Clostridiaceae bacterium]
MIQKGSNYVYGTAAEKIEYDVYEHNQVLKEKKIRRNNAKIKWKAVFGILVVFSLCLVLMYRYALITEMSLTAIRSEKEYNEIKNKNSRLRVEIEKQTDINTIMKIAEEKLNMQKPEKNQIVYIYVPKNDYTVVSEDYENKEETLNKGMLAALLDKVDKFASILY